MTRTMTMLVVVVLMVAMAIKMLRRQQQPISRGIPPGGNLAQADLGQLGWRGGHGVQVAAVQAPFAGAVVAPVAAVFWCWVGVVTGGGGGRDGAVDGWVGVGAMPVGVVVGVVVAGLVAGVAGVGVGVEEGVSCAGVAGV
jgi:hypothetical protein